MIPMNTSTTTAAAPVTSSAPASNGATAPNAKGRAKQNGKRATVPKGAQLTSKAGAPGDSLVSNGGAQVAPSTPAAVSAEVRKAANPVEAAQAEVRRLQGLLTETQRKLATALADEEPPAPITDKELAPLLAAHISAGSPLGKWALTDAQKAQWKATKKKRKDMINGRLFRRKVVANVTRAANVGGFQRYREKVAAKSKKVLGFTLGASLTAPKAAKK